MREYEREYKGFIIKPSIYNLYCIVHNSGGRVPEDLCGNFSNYRMATIEIDKHLTNKENKKKK